MNVVYFHIILRQLHEELNTTPRVKLSKHVHRDNVQIHVLCESDVAMFAINDRGFEVFTLFS